MKHYRMAFILFYFKNIVSLSPPNNLSLIKIVQYDTAIILIYLNSNPCTWNICKLAVMYRENSGELIIKMKTFIYK